MQKNIEIAKSIIKNIPKNWQEELEDINTWDIFKPLHHIKLSMSVANAITAYIIFAYDNDSPWLNYHQDRDDNKQKILNTIGYPLMSLGNEIVFNKHAQVNDVIASYLESQVTYKWKVIISRLDFSAEMLRLAMQRPDEGRKEDIVDKEGNKQTLITDYDAEKLAKVNIMRNQFFSLAEEARNKADVMMKELSGEFLELNQAVKSDFGFELTTEKTIHYPHWRDWIRNVAIPERTRRQMEKEAAK